ncbi:MAG: peptidoglycan-binding protein, partial [Oscillospiraceae bacterium]|nr:peptidoglycan-binding protein [Oscillospiraceae bacterium]
MDNKGTLEVRLTTADHALPVASAEVTVFDMELNSLYTLHTDQSGITKWVELPAPPAQTQLDSNLPVKPYSRYIVEIIADGFHKTIVNGVQIYDNAPSYLPINLKPLQKGQPPEEIWFDIGENALEMAWQSGSESAPSILPEVKIHREVFIPTHITVHLGTPASNARNVTVPFIDYIKNVASSEIFPDWPYHSLRANIHAQISLALNRVFTEWYRGKSYNFDITNSTQFDQYFVEGRNIFESVSVIADEIFNSYIIRPPGVEPFFAEYCNGTTAWCPGMKQWGTVTLANQGMNYLQILRYYYGQSIYIATTDNIRTPFESFRGNLALGSSGQDVAMIQMMLARIGRNYPAMPAVSVDGSYGSQTVAAVRRFQQIFGLAQTGTVDRRTWYSISNIYAAVMKLAELGSEGHQPPVIIPPTGMPPFPGTNLSVGSSGNNVRLIQQAINTIA